jgi:hypothetical protein
MSEQKSELSSITLIKDSVLEPYFIGKDSYCYTIYENAVSSENASKTYLRTWGHYTNLSMCLKNVAKLKINKKKEYTSLKEYIDSWTQLLNNYNQLINPEL